MMRRAIAQVSHVNAPVLCSWLMTRDIPLPGAIRERLLNAMHERDEAEAERAALDTQLAQPGLDRAARADLRQQLAEAQWARDLAMARIRQTVFDAAAAHWPYSALADVLGVSRQAVHAIKTRGAPLQVAARYPDRVEEERHLSSLRDRRQQRRHITREEATRLRQLIERSWKVHEDTVEKLEAGALLEDLRRAGVPWQEIAEATNSHVISLRKRLERYLTLMDASDSESAAV